MQLIEPIRQFLKIILDDYQCCVCGNTTALEKAWCDDCESKFRKIKNACPSCRLPQLKNEFCEDCRGSPKKLNPIQQVYCDYIYSDTIEKLIKKIKYSYAPFLATALVQKTDTHPDLLDAIIPVPTSGKHLWKRRYNQAALLANHVSKRYEMPIYWDILQTSATKQSQTRQNRSQRLSLKKGGFSIKNIEIIKNKSLLLVDDVMTTGATLKECAKILMDHGAKNVQAWVLARVPKGAYV